MGKKLLTVFPILPNFLDSKKLEMQGFSALYPYLRLHLFLQKQPDKLTDNSFQFIQ